MSMLRFLGLPTPPKKAKTSEEKTQSRRKYESSKRERTFQTNWLKKYSWLRYDDHKQKMFCTLCEEYDTSGQGTFISGCGNFRLDSLNAHEKSESHIKSLGKQVAKTTKPGSSSGDKAILMMNKAALEKLKVMFRNAHYIAKMGRPYTDYVALCHLDNAKGLDIGRTYHTDKYCQKFIAAIAEHRKIEQDSIIKNAPFISIISDGSTDSSCTEAEIVYLKTSVDCKPYTFFVGIKNVAKGDAQHITDGICSIMSKRFGEAWQSKIIAMGTDGASVMTGIKSGVVKKMADATERPFIRSIHCSAHRLELAYKDTAKDCSMSKKCDLLLLNLYLFYKYSPLYRSNLKASFKSLEQKVVLPTRVGGTRWIPHTKRALENILTGYKAITQHLEQMQATSTEFRKEASAKARNFLKLLKDKSVVAWLHLTMDVVKCLSTVSTTIQNQESTLADIFDEIEAAKVLLAKYRVSNGPYLRKVEPNDELVATQKTKLLNSLIQHLNERFNSDLHLFEASSILSIGKWPENFEPNKDYGDEEVASLASLCEPALKASVPDIDVNAIETEWTRLKTKIKSRKENTTWQQLAKDERGKLANFFLLVDYLLTLPGSSVDAERGFSCMKMTKNDWRSRLGEQNLSDLMMICMEVDEVGKYDPLPAIQLWYSGGIRSRRPFYIDDLKKNVMISENVPVAQLQDGNTENDININDVNDDDNVNIQPAAAADDDDYNNDEDDEEFYREDLRLLQIKSYKMLQQFM